MTPQIKDTVKAFIIENFLFGDTSYALDDDVSLIESGVVDSTGVLELVTFIEDQFGLEMADSDIVPANLDSLVRITAFIETKMAKAQPTEQAAGAA
ncbi:acyl carrier protein [Aminobacter aganoensis]|uniref:Acyl carrier protein n=1 Tax=Aminobacter aganoensis TaxID=83264 RepID=A0A7X0KJ99_9HYPH|nr:MULTISPECIES: acyl carrier protein [Aminobacter]KQU65851.1 acyl carrier protein [Aminobacter sp. DSM 101952]MBB6353083.1 acyl carrier protein [Aminobacter aganoensis]